MSKVLISGNLPFVPVVRALIEQEHEIVTIRPQFAAELRNLELPVRGLIELGTPQVNSKALAGAARLVKEAGELDGQVEMGGLSEGARKFMGDGLAGYLYSKVGDLALFVECMDVYDTDVVVVHNDVEPLTRAAALWARARGKPCLHVPHAIYHEVENKYDIHSVITASHLASAGHYQSDWYRTRGFAGAAIAETGLPQFDEYALLALDRQKAQGLLGLDLRRPVICYASSWAQNTNLLGMHDGVEEVYRGVLACAKLMEDVQFLIKVHPRDRNGEMHVKLAKELEAKVVVTANHLPQVLMASDLVFAYGPSNILLEASHVPWLRLACTSGYETDREVAKIKADPVDVEFMAAALRALLKSPTVDLASFRWRYLGRCDGGNSARVVEMVGRLIGG